MFFNLKSGYQELVNKIIIMIESLFFVIGLNYYLRVNDDFLLYSIFNFILFVYVYKFFSKKKISEDKKIVVYLFSFIFSLVLLIGKQIYLYNSLKYILNNILIFIISIIGFFSFFTRVINDFLIYIENINFSHNGDIEKKFTNKHILLVIWIIIFISWIPTFLALYPGIFSYDSIANTEQALSGSFSYYSKFHPPLHTMIWAIFLNIGKFSRIEPLSLYSLTQMLFLSFALSKVIKLLIDKKINYKIIICSILFFCINPVISVFSLEMTKDVFFSVFFILSIVEIIYLISEPKKYLANNLNKSKCIIFISLLLLFRNNVIYAYVLSLPIIIFSVKKKYKKGIIVLILPIIVYFFINNCIYNYLGIKEGNSRESLSVPMQQIANVVANNKISDSYKRKIDLFLEYDQITNLYNPRFADPIKNCFKTEYYNNNKFKFYKLYLELFLKYPMDYIDSFLSLNLPYWYFDAKAVDDYSKRKYIALDYAATKEYSPVMKSKIPILEKYYRKIVSYEFVKKIPVINLLFSLALPLILMICSTIDLNKKISNKKIAVISLPFLLWVTYIFGPVSNFRYIFPFVLMYPIFLCLIICPNEILK